MRTGIRAGHCPASSASEDRRSPKREGPPHRGSLSRIWWVVLGSLRSLELLEVMVTMYAAKFSDGRELILHTPPFPLSRMGTAVGDHTEPATPVKSHTAPRDAIRPQAECVPYSTRSSQRSRQPEARLAPQPNLGAFSYRSALLEQSDAVQRVDEHRQVSEVEQVGRAAASA